MFEKAKVDGLPVSQVAMITVLEKAAGDTVTHLLYDKGTDSQNTCVLKPGPSKIQKLVQSGCVTSVLMKEASRLSREYAMLDMHYKIFNKTGTNFWHGAVGVDQERHLRALKERRERQTRGGAEKEEM